jgi:hypothetical protein
MLFPSSYSKRLAALGVEPPDEDVLCDITQIETRARVQLPKSYKRFLKDCGGWWGDLLCDCTVPTPFGAHNIAGFHEADVVYSLLDSNIAPRNTITIAVGHLGQHTVLSVAGIDYGAVYALDAEFRSRWSDEKFHQRFNAIADEIESYLHLRRDGMLPEKHDSYDCLYHVADSFDEFIAKCRSVPGGG